MNLEIGTTYYRVTYADVSMTMPGIEPLVYVGIDIFQEGESDTHFFQDTVSVVVSGILAGDGEVRVYPIKDTEIGLTIVDITALPAVVSEALARYVNLGKPKLNKSKGNWV